MASADAGAAASHREDPAQTVHGGGCPGQQTLSGEDAASPGRRRHQGFYSQRREVSVWLLSFRGQADSRVGASAAGGRKLRPVLTHQRRSGALKSDASSILPMFRTWNKKAWMASHLFTVRLGNILIPSLGTTTQKKKGFLSNRTAL